MLMKNQTRFQYLQGCIFLRGFEKLPGGTFEKLPKEVTKKSVVKQYFFDSIRNHCIVVKTVLKGEVKGRRNTRWKIWNKNEKHAKKDVLHSSLSGSYLRASVRSRILMILPRKMTTWTPSMSRRERALEQMSLIYLSNVHIMNQWMWFESNLSYLEAQFLEQWDRNGL